MEAEAEVIPSWAPNGPFLVRPHPLIDVRIRTAEEHSGDDALTVCIAARCGNIVVAASDRMLTAGDIQFEPSSPIKVQQFSNLSFIMTAGDAALSAEIVQETGNQVRERIDREPTNVWLIKDIVDIFIKNYNLAKVKRSEAQILAPLSLDRQSFISKQRSLSDTLASDLSKELINFDMPQMACIIAGVDMTGSHIYVIRDNQYSCADSIGFAAVGIGARHALSQLMLSGQTFNTSLTDTVLAVYNAKKRAEIAPGVGTHTIMVWVGGGVPFAPIHQDLMGKLESEYQRTIKTEKTAFLKARSEVARYVEGLVQKASKTGAGNVAQEPPSAEGSAGGQTADGT